MLPEAVRLAAVKKGVRAAPLPVRPIHALNRSLPISSRGSSQFRRFNRRDMQRPLPGAHTDNPGHESPVKRLQPYPSSGCACCTPVSRRIPPTAPSAWASASPNRRPPRLIKTAPEHQPGGWRVIRPRPASRNAPAGRVDAAALRPRAGPADTQIRPSTARAKPCLRWRRR